MAASGVKSASTSATVKSFVDPSLDIVKTIPQGIIELGLRGTGAVLAFISIITAAVCLGYVGNISDSSFFSFRLNVQSTVRSLGVRTNYAAGWVIFLSFWVIFYQCLAIVQLFLKVNIAYSITIPVVHWSLFFLLDIIAICVSAGGYFCAATPLAVYAGEWSNTFVTIIILNQLREPPTVALNSNPIASLNQISASSGATSALCFFNMLFFIGMIIYFFVAKYVLKWPTHSEEAIGRQASAVGDGY